MTMTELIKEKFNNKDYVKVDKIIFAIDEVKQCLNDFDYSSFDEDDIVEYRSQEKILRITFKGWSKLIDKILKEKEFETVGQEVMFHRELLENCKRFKVIEDYDKPACLCDVTVDLKA